VKSRRHALGQHFLKNPRVLAKIVDAISPQPPDVIVEVGPGEGRLTSLLSVRAAHVIAIEKDRRLIPGLEQKEIPNLTVLHADVLDVRFSDLMKGSRLTVVGNLPYAISSAFLQKVWDERAIIERGCFLLQKEVGERVCAEPGTKRYGPISVILRNHFEARLVFTLGPGAFSPPPKVDSALVSLTRRPRPLVAIPEENGFPDFVRDLFHERRKTLRNNLKRMGFGASDFEEIATLSGFSLQDRPERLSLEQFAALYAAFQSHLHPPS
jgi:16S rRNA (adenine1518-N6/adenine1519-N6)-dimethyltransferase